jgi:4-methylaminobutanoate oxidase (formaldehyde-forming)
VSANDIDRPAGSLVYTQWCDDRGGMVADVTVSRLAADRFRVVTGAGYVASELAWLRTHADGADGPVTIRDASAELSTIGLWGPRARDILAATTVDDVGDAGIPLRRAADIRIGDAPVHAARISYAGELGWELTTPAEWAVAVWDALWAAGAGHGIEPFGYRALDMLRMEKGYRYFGTDLTMLDTPFEAGFGAFVRLGKGPFIGREALDAARGGSAVLGGSAGATGTGTRGTGRSGSPGAAQGDSRGADQGGSPGALDRRLRTLAIGRPGYLPVYGGEAVRDGGEVVSRLRSVAYGPTVGRTIAYAYLPATMAEGAVLEIDVFDKRVAAVVSPDVLVDPAGERMRG